MTNIDPAREACIQKLTEMQKSLHIRCDIIGPTTYMSTQVLIEHTDAYVDYLRRAEAGNDA